MKNVVGLIAAGVSLIALIIIFARMWNLYHEAKNYKFVILIATGAGGLCALVRLLEVLSSKGTIKIPICGERKSLVAWLITILVIIGGGFTAIAVLIIGIRLRDVSSWETFFSGKELVKNLKAELIVDIACSVVAAVASLLNFVIGILQIKEANAQQAGPPPS